MPSPSVSGLFSWEITTKSLGRKTPSTIVGKGTTPKTWATRAVLPCWRHSSSSPTNPHLQPALVLHLGPENCQTDLYSLRPETGISGESHHPKRKEQKTPVFPQQIMYPDNNTLNSKSNSVLRRLTASHQLLPLPLLSQDSQRSSHLQSASNADTRDQKTGEEHTHARTRARMPARKLLCPFLKYANTHCPTFFSALIFLIPPYWDFALITQSPVISIQMHISPTSAAFDTVSNSLLQIHMLNLASRTPLSSSSSCLQCSPLFILLSWLLLSPTSYYWRVLGLDPFTSSHLHLLSNLGDLLQSHDRFGTFSSLASNLLPEPPAYRTNSLLR